MVCRDNKINYRYMDDLYLEQFKLLVQQNFVRKTPLEVVKLNNAIIYPVNMNSKNKGGGVVDAKDQYIEFSGFNVLSEIDGYQKIEGKSKKEQKKIKKNTIEEDVVYLGLMRIHWGHFLMDSLSRIWYILSNSNCTAKILYFGERLSRNGNIEEFLNLLGIDMSRLIYIDKPVLCKSIVVPEPSFLPGRYITEEFSNMFKNMCDIVNLDGIPQYSKIYLTRRKLTSYLKTEFGEELIEKFFKINGYKVIALEKLTVKEQIYYLSHADTIACISGTLSHMLMFASDESRITIIRKTFKHNYRQIALNQIKKFNFTYIDAHISLSPVDSSGPFWLQINDNIRRFAIDNNMKIFETQFPRKYLIKYLISLVKRNLISFVKGKGFMSSFLYSADGKFSKKVRIKELVSFYSKRL